jgi:hypothetical protein
MSHFGDENWFDYVRNLLPPDQMQAMETHLHGNCAECIELYDIWKRVFDTVTRESQYTPHPSDVKRVTAAFDREQRVPVPPAGLLAALVFDSLHSPAPVGFRSALAHARHLLFEADNWTIALRLKAQPPNQVSLVGHVTQSGSLGTEGSHLQVTVSRRGSVIAQTTTNNLGEFHLEYQNLSALRLHVSLSGEHGLEVDLPAPEH